MIFKFRLSSRILGVSLGFAQGAVVLGIALAWLRLCLLADKGSGTLRASPPVSGTSLFRPTVFWADLWPDLGISRSFQKSQPLSAAAPVYPPGLGRWVSCAEAPSGSTAWTFCVKLTSGTAVPQFKSNTAAFPCPALRSGRTFLFRFGFPTVSTRVHLSSPRHRPQGHYLKLTPAGLAPSETASGAHGISDSRTHSYSCYLVPRMLDSKLLTLFVFSLKSPCELVHG